MRKDAESDGAAAYARRVQEGTQRYAHELLAENDRLRTILMSLEAERSRLQDRLQAVEATSRENDVLRTLVASLENEKLRLHEQLVRVRGEMDGHRKEQARLETQLKRIEDDSRRFQDQYAEVEQQNSNLANLYVASYRLQGTLDRQEVLASIQDIVANLIGSEQVAIFDVAPDGESLSLAWSFGVDASTYQGIRVGSGAIGRVALTGESYVAGRSEAPAGPREEANLTACIPLKVEGAVIGAIAIFRLLPQKSGLQPIDYELFDLLATHAATALHCSGVHERLRAQAVA